MDASSRLYTRLGEIPDDPNDPESLDDLLVCAFGAFERYYVCWKTRGGEYRQDGYDLPVALRDWLYPTDGTIRDFATLQVVFGRGEEYFASDQYSKLEYKEPEAKKPTEDGEKIEKKALRRSRTVSFLRPLSETSTRSDGSATDSVASRRSSSFSSQRRSRPPSLSHSRTNSEVFVSSRPSSQSQSTLPFRTTSPSPVYSQRAALSSSAADSNQFISLAKASKRYSEAIVETGPELQAEEVPKDTSTELPSTSPVRMARWVRPLDMSPKRVSLSNGFQGSLSSSISSSPSKPPSACTCGCHDPQLKSKSKPTYANASVQTDPVPSPPRTALRIDTTSSYWPSYRDYSAVSQDVETPPLEQCNTTNPVYMGRMMDYFSMPGYQLGDSLMNGYKMSQKITYQYQYEFGDEALR